MRGCEIRRPNTLFVGDFYQAPPRPWRGGPLGHCWWSRPGSPWLEGVERAHPRPDERARPRLNGGQPQGQDHVRDWADGLDLPIGGETIMFVDCEAAFYCTSNTRATAQVLQRAGVEFGLMNEQWCCGGRPRRWGT